MKLMCMSLGVKAHDDIACIVCFPAESVFTLHFYAIESRELTPGEMMHADEHNSTRCATPIDCHASFVFYELAADLANVAVGFILFVPKGCSSYQLVLHFRTS